MDWLDKCALIGLLLILACIALFMSTAPIMRVWDELWQMAELLGHTL